MKQLKKEIINKEINEYIKEYINSKEFKEHVKKCITSIFSGFFSRNISGSYLVGGNSEDVWQVELEAMIKRFELRINMMFDAKLGKELEKEVKKTISSEHFIDEIVERINRKQLKLSEGI